MKASADEQSSLVHVVHSSNVVGRPVGSRSRRRSGAFRRRSADRQARYAQLHEGCCRHPGSSTGEASSRDEERAARLKLLAQRLRDPDSLDRDTLAQIEHLTAVEQ
jgi:hypothetical protein